MSRFDLPVDYDKLSPGERRQVRLQYIEEQKGFCYWCNEPLDQPAPERITSKSINWDNFPPGFLRHPIHLQHDHWLGLTEGAVHSYCNAVMWEYEGR